MTISNFNIHFYHNELLEIAEAEKRLKARKKTAINDITENYREYLREKLLAKPEPFGTVNLHHGEYEVKYIVPKDVSWDQEKLAELYKRISEHEDPNQYIQVTYKVSETSYKSWPDDIKKAFDPARTVKEGAERIEIKKEES